MSPENVAAAPNILWRDTLEAAREEASKEGKLVLIYLFHHGCGGSRTMGTYTYPDPGVEEYIERHFVPVRFNVREEPEVERSFSSGWTPTLIFEDATETEHRRSAGYLDVKQFIGELSLARVMEAIDRRDRVTAPERTGEALDKTAGDPAREPENLYWSAVAAYHAADDDREKLVSGWERLLERFPDSEWARRASYIQM